MHTKIVSSYVRMTDMMTPLTVTDEVNGPRRPSGRRRCRLAKKMTKMSMNDPEQKGDAAGGHMILSSRERYLTFEISIINFSADLP